MDENMRVIRLRLKGNKTSYIVTTLFLATAFGFLDWNGMVSMQESTFHENTLTAGEKATNTAKVVNVHVDITSSQESSSSRGGDNLRNKHDFNGNHDKGPIIDILDKADVDITPEILQELPTWTDVTSIYGSEPIIEGLDTCEAFQSTIPLTDRLIGIAGLENTGTNLLGNVLQSYCVIPERYERFKDSSYYKREFWKTGKTVRTIIINVPNVSIISSSSSGLTSIFHRYDGASALGEAQAT